MSHTKKLAAGLGAIAVLGFSVPFATGGDHGPHGAKPRNVILFIGDGMGDSEVTSARYYQYGAEGRLNVDELPVSGFQTHWSVKPAGKPDYAPDSASTGTMWATGEKTIDERISQGPSAAEAIPGKNLPTILEKAQEAGKKAGNVSTAEITGATPAVLNSHISPRGCQGPTDTDKTCPTESKKAGGLGSIAEQYATQNKGYTEVTDAAGLAAAKRSDRPLLGLFNGGNMTTEWTGPQATLILVTADHAHAHTSQIVAEDLSGTGNPTGYSNNLITADDQVMRITHGTAGGTERPAVPPSQQHTGTVVPIWGQGPGSTAVSGTTDHTDLFDLINRANGHR